MVMIDDDINTVVIIIMVLLKRYFHTDDGVTANARITPSALSKKI